MKSRLAVSFGGVVDEERKHLGKETSGIKGVRAPGQRIDQAFLGRLAFRHSLLGIPKRRIGRAFLGRLAFGPSPIGALGLDRLARGTECGPMVPTMPPFSVDEEDHPRSEKKRNKLDRHIIGNSRPSMLLNFQRKFCNFFETKLDAIGSCELIMRFRGSYKRLVGE